MAAPGPVVDPQDRNKIKVSSGRSVFFYVDLATRFLKDQEDVELSGLGYAITTVVTIAEILKNQGIASVKKINTSTMDIKERPVSKAKIEITLIKTPKFFEIVEQKEAAKAAPAAPEAAKATAPVQSPVPTTA